jgi:glutaconate CoA-transferase subunit A
MSGKVVALTEAASHFRPGLSLGVGGGPLLAAPAALIREAIRRGAGGFKLIACSTGGYGLDLLIGAGCAVSAEFAQVSLYEYGFAPNFRRFAEAGRLRCLDHT